ncbi:TonB-dependent receptor domain-containing protein [Microbulbifer agarilyticus]|uniref:TonB-dependent receptor domain-containing protein n=1 Tax=Microbulbifer agarilyticus TaxID=260552 RepID=UPI001CD3BC73|nr:TonB-dependent receptor [Microbulbifer agarilyticus]MCA0892979.1 TonB-dependent receptor [Microbulbifer agarilyticus]
MTSNRSLNKTLAKSILALAIGATTAYAQDVEEKESAIIADSENSEAAEVEEVYVTGSRIRRGNFDGATNVEVISRDDMALEGVSGLDDMIDNLAQSTGATQGEQYTNSFTPAASSINFRGLGGNRTLVLLNGYRMPEYPLPFNGQSNFFNTSALPYSAVDRVDVLNNGGSAVYGSDAVAGVVNIFTRKAFDGTEMTVDFATTTEGGGDEQAFEFVTGKTFDKGWLTFAADYRSIDPIYGKDRDWLDSYKDQPRDQPYPDRALLEFNNITGLYMDPGAETCENSGTGYFYAERPGRGFYCGHDGDGDETLQSAQDRYNVYVSGEYELSENLTAFGTVLYNNTEISQDGFRLWWGGDILTADYATDNWQNSYLYLQKIFSPAETGAQSTVYEEEAINFQAGLRGTFAFSDNDYDWDLAVTAGNYDSYNSQIRFKEEKINEYYLGTEDLFGFGIPTGGEGNVYEFLPADVAADLLGTNWQDANSQSAQVTFNISGPTGFTLPGGDVYFAASLEAAYNEYDIELDERTLNQDGQGWFALTGTEGGGDRNRYAGSFEVSMPLTDSMEANVAARFDQYDDASDVGGRLTTQGNYRWDITDWVAVRTSYAQSFRAPDMHYMFKDPSGFYTGAYDYVNCSPDGTTDDECVSESVYSLSSGNPDLKEEEGQNFGFGFVFTPVDDLKISIDYVDIRLTDVVTSESVDALLKDERDCTFNISNRDSGSEFCQSVFAKVERTIDPISGDNAIGVLYTGPVNESDLQYKGVDVSIDYDLHTESLGTFGLKLDYSNTMNWKEREFSGDELIDYRDEMYDARTSGKGTVSWLPNEDFVAAFTVLRTSSILNYAEDGRVDPWYTGNLFMQYNYSDNLNVDMTVNNVTNERPPEDATWTGWPYFYRGIYNAYGRKVSVGVNYAF